MSHTTDYSNQGNRTNYPGSGPMKYQPWSRGAWPHDVQAMSPCWDYYQANPPIESSRGNAFASTYQQSNFPLTYSADFGSGLTPIPFLPPSAHSWPWPTLPQTNRILSSPQSIRQNGHQVPLS